MSEQESTSRKWKRQVGVVLQPKNLLKTIAGQIPGASIPTSLIDQIEAHEAGLKIGRMEADLAALKALQTAEQSAPKTPAPLHDWSIPVGVYLRRIVDIIVVYSSRFHSEEAPDRDLFQLVAHGCLFTEKDFLTCKEAFEMAEAVADHKSGRVMVAHGPAWYDCEFSEIDRNTGLCVGRLTNLNEEKWNEYCEMWTEKGFRVEKGDLPSDVLPSSVSPWMGQEFGFIHSGEAENVMRGASSYTKLQFDTGVVSHFRNPSSDGLKIFVSGVLGGRVLKAGSPAFGRDGRLLGILSGAESYECDAGRRAVVRSLLGHPCFTSKEKILTEASQKGR